MKGLRSLDTVPLILLRDLNQMELDETGDDEIALDANEEVFVLQAVGTTATVLKAGADPLAGKVPISALAKL